MPTSQKKTGDYGEELAANHLKSKGFTIIETNWHCTYGEVDIVAQIDDRLVFVEVRTHHAATTESAFASITPTKREKMMHTAYAYIQANDIPEDTLWRIDVIAVALPYRQPPIIDHMEDALGW